MFWDNVNSYNETNCMLKKEAEDPLSEYASKIIRLPDGRDSELHTANRSGDVNIHHANNITQTHTVAKNGEFRMHNAKGYHETNAMQRNDASDTILEYQNIFQWTPKEDVLLLDIDTGSGDVTMDYILPVLPSKSRIIASDKSLEMVEYARINFPHSRITYEKLDIENENDVDEVLDKFGQFHHITSFFCLHWAAKQSDVMENIFKLLQPDGVVLMTILQHHPLLEHYADLSELPKWSMHRLDLKKNIFPYFRNENPEKELFSRMERAGFVDINVVLKHRIATFDRHVFIESTAPTSPILENMSESLKDEFLQIYINKVSSMDLPAPHKSNKERNDGKIIFPFHMLVAHGKKPITKDTGVGS